jgi:uncharacterized metal-binding protein
MNDSPSSSASCVVLACSGSSDTGEIADRAARKLERLGLARMCCLAGVGSHVETIEAATKGASVVVVLDGCAHGCGAKSLMASGVKNLLHLDLSQFMEKGKSPVSDMLVNQVVDRVAIMLRERHAGQN